MANFKCLKKLFNMEGEIILDKDKIYNISNEGLEFTEGGKNRRVELSYLLNGGFIEQIDPLELKVSELPDSEFEIEKNYRIQLDVRTTKTKLIEIETHIRQIINDLLYVE